MHNRRDDDCDGRTDEDAFDEGRVFLSEIARQPRLGAPSIQVDAQWIELASTADAPIDLHGLRFVRENVAAGKDTFEITGSLVIPARGFVLLCKDPSTELLACDYRWGDRTRPQAWAIPGRDNTFNLQRDEDSLSIWAGDERSGRLVDRVAWTQDPVSPWPREAAWAMVLDPLVTNAADNDQPGAWCVAKGNTWWAVGKDREYGTPGAANPPCR